MKVALDKIQWDVVWSVLRTLLVAGGPVATLLIALDFPPILVGKWMAIGLAFIGVASVAGPGLKGALLRTDSNKAAAVTTISPEAKATVAAQLPAEITVAAAVAVPGVEVQVKTESAPAAVVALAHDDAQPHINPV